ncbi:MAG: D-2-hydroxyacid dehydrogenase [Gemmatimonadota bacterium]
MSRLVLNLRDPRPVWSIPDAIVDEIRRAAPPRLEVVVVDAIADGRGDGGAAAPEALEAVAEAEIYVGFGFPEPLLEAARGGGDRLRWVHSASAGVGGSLYPAMRDSTVVLTNSAGIHAEPMAETVIGMIHYFARGLDFAVHGQRQRRWENEPFEATDTVVRELAGATVGILGYGGIGQAVGRRAAALGMRVLAFRRSRADPDPAAEQVSGSAGLGRLLRESQYIVLALPRTRETEGLLDPDRIASLRPDAVVINVGRGELIHEEALTEALQEGRIRGAGLDVFAREPLPESSPLWGLPNVLVTPHASATTHRFWKRQLDLVLENLRRYESGEPLLNTVDKSAGY